MTFAQSCRKLLKDLKKDKTTKELKYKGRHLYDRITMLTTLDRELFSDLIGKEYSRLARFMILQERLARAQDEVAFLDMLFNRVDLETVSRRDEKHIKSIINERIRDLEAGIKILEGEK